ncbi:MAG: IS3 family transposase [Terriglobales bacterium]
MWSAGASLASRLFDWIEGWYNPTRRHSALNYQSPIQYENLSTPALTAA